MSRPIYCGDCKDMCCVMRSTHVGVWLDNGPLAVRSGDVYACPICGKEVIIGAEMPVTTRNNAQLVQRVKNALDTAGTPYVSHQYVVENH